MAKKGDEVDKKIAEILDSMSSEITKTLAKRIQKAKKLDTQDKLAYLDHMNAEEINQLLSSILPIIKLESGKYMIGTEKKNIAIKSDRLLIRTGGGFTTLEDHIKQNGPFECIKISKVMRDKNCSFKLAVKFYLEKHKSIDKVISDFMKTDEANSEMFAKAIEKLREQQNQKQV